jgi:hypothetical protein
MNHLLIASLAPMLAFVVAVAYLLAMIYARQMATAPVTKSTGENK